jgi:hypothetical protein
VSRDKRIVVEFPANWSTMTAEERDVWISELVAAVQALGPDETEEPPDEPTPG